MVHFQNEKGPILQVFSDSKGVVKYWAMCCLGYSKSALEAEGDFSITTICSTWALLALGSSTMYYFFWVTRRSFLNVTVMCRLEVYLRWMVISALLLYVVTSNDGVVRLKVFTIVMFIEKRILLRMN